MSLITEPPISGTRIPIPELDVRRDYARSVELQYSPASGSNLTTASNLLKKFGIPPNNNKLADQALFTTITTLSREKPVAIVIWDIQNRATVTLDIQEVETRPDSIPPPLDRQFSIKVAPGQRFTASHLQILGLSPDSPVFSNSEMEACLHQDENKHPYLEFPITSPTPIISFLPKPLL